MSTKTPDNLNDAYNKALDSYTSYYETLQESPETQNYLEEYKKYEFCKDINCPCLISGNCIVQHIDECLYTAKEFHKWLNKNDYKIIKRN